LVNSRFILPKGKKNQLNILYHKAFKMLKNTGLIFAFLLLSACQNFGQLKLVADLPKDLKEVSGTEIVVNSKFIWMLNDSGNKSILYGISKKGNIKKEIKINAKN
jgi:hypothetical protein